jgi:hypothetical protein
MASRCKIPINVVTMNKPKMLTGLTQNGNVAGTGSRQFPVVNIQATGEEG